MIINRRYEVVPLSTITVHPDNPRKGDVEMIEESISTNGFFGAVIVQESTHYILIGNHRYIAEQRLGGVEIPVIYVDVDDATARKMMLADNRANDRALYDEQALLAMLQEIAQIDPDLTGTGFLPSDVDDLLARLELDLAADDGTAAAGSDDNDDSFWPVMRLKLHPDVHDQLQSLLADAPGRNECEQLAALLSVVDTTALAHATPPRYDEKQAPAEQGKGRRKGARRR